MATKYVKFRGKAMWCKPWEHQIDREYEDSSNPRDRGGNFSINLIVDDATLKTFNALGSLGKPKETDEGHVLTFRRYEKLSNGTPLRSRNVQVKGVEQDQPIGNGSDVTVIAEVYPTSYRNKAITGVRWAGLEVHELVEFKKRDVLEQDAKEELPF